MKLARLIKMCLNEIYSEVRTGKPLADSFPIQNAHPPKGDTLLEYAIKKVQETQVKPKLNGSHQLLAYADDVNILGDNIDTIKETIGTVIDASREVALEINLEKTKYMTLSRHRNAGQNRDIQIANKSFENVSQFRYL
jgi:hypothetical protein